MTKIGPYEVHPAAEVFPLIEGVEFDELAHDILDNGLQEPIVLNHDGTMLVDGRNRYRACEAVTVDPVFKKLHARYTDAMIRDFVVSSNLRRRQLNPGQRAMVALKLEPLYAADAKERQGTRTDLVEKNITPDLVESPRSDRESRAKAGTAVGASRTAVGQAKAVQRDAPDLAEKVVAGEMALDAADRERKKRNAAMPKPDPVPKVKKNVAQPVLLTLKTHDGNEVKYPKPQSKATFNETTGAGISWAAWSWNPVTGCLHGCDYCYAREIATNERFKHSYPIGFTPLFHHERLDAPANTAIPAARRDDPAYKRVFVCSMADLYGRWVPQDWIERVHGSMLATPDWQYITLTKFPDRYVGLEMPPGAWVGTSIDEQKRVRIAQRAFEKLPKGVVKWLSLEPLLEPLEFDDLSMFDWIVIGAQTETRQPSGVVRAFAPPFEWVARIVLQAREAGCRIHMKPNLLGRVDGSSPGMKLLDEYPLTGPSIEVL